ncbi:tumor necrosis factor receptor superfamily member 10D isoform X2 [Rhinolophus sinicus]|uniref:tumor necrosis factor receptor superfamily member 10D isoform X2 n=1 Tax=Rhinolophus sinicus TaxID=89399 RepID=UPI003D7B978F
MKTLSGPGAPRNSTGQRGHRALAASGAPAPRSPAPVRARGARLPLWDPGTLIFVVFALLWPVPTASAMTTGEDRVHQQRAAPQEGKHSLSDRECSPGFYLSEFSGDCTPCTHGMDFTSYSNKLPSCQVCSSCRPGEEEISSCTLTKDRECQCKPGTYLEENSPELCQPCSTRCPDGMVEAEPCTPWSDLKCDKQESGSSELVLRIVPGTVCAVLLLLSACACYHRKCIFRACGVDPECVNTVIFRRSCPPRGPGAVDNSRNEIISNRNSLSTLASEQELGHQEPAELEGVLIQSPVEAEHLLEPAGAEGSQMRKEPSVPANDADLIEA